MAEDYNPNDFEWRFQNSLKEHRGKLDSLPDRERVTAERDLRVKFAQHERDDWAVLTKAEDNYLEQMEKLSDAHEAETKRYVDEVHRAYHEQEKDTTEAVWARFQDRQKGADHDKERER